VDGEEGFDAFQFDDENSIDAEIEAVADVESYLFVNDREFGFDVDVQI
jgi:hypothetical protein